MEYIVFKSIRVIVSKAKIETAGGVMNFVFNGYKVSPRNRFNPLFVDWWRVRGEFQVSFDLAWAINGVLFDAFRSPTRV